MRRGALLAVLALAAGGCVERVLQIRSAPPARAYFNDRLVGITPVEVPFDFYGTSEVRLEADGYQPIVAMVPLRPPIYQWFPIDLFFEVVWPFTLRDTHEYHATLTRRPTGPDAAAAAAGLLDRAEQARESGDLPAGDGE